MCTKTSDYSQLAISSILLKIYALSLAIEDFGSSLGEIGDC